MVGTALPTAGIDQTDFDSFANIGHFFVPNLAAGTYTWFVHAVYKPGLCRREFRSRSRCRDDGPPRRSLNDSPECFVYRMEATVSDEIKTEDTTPREVSRRESIRLAAAAALGAGLGAPAQLIAIAPAAGAVAGQVLQRIHGRRCAFGGVALTDAVTSFIASLAGARTQIKWYDAMGRELGTMGIPSIIQEKIRAALTSGE